MIYVGITALLFSIFVAPFLIWYWDEQGRVMQMRLLVKKYFPEEFSK